MKVNELRIGNYVTYNPESVDEGILITPLLVTAIDDEGGVILNDGYENVYDFGEILPILLTPEIMKKAGFEFYHIGHNDFHLIGHYSKGSFFLSAYTNGKYGYEWGEEGDSRDIDHLHQLQNLYFALTGEELSINVESFKLQ